MIFGSNLDRKFFILVPLPVHPFLMFLILLERLEQYMLLNFLTDQDVTYWVSPNFVPISSLSLRMQDIH